MTKKHRTNRDPIKIEIGDEDRALNSLGWFFYHGAMHAGQVPMILDEYGRCARCVKLGFWKPDA